MNTDAGLLPDQSLTTRIVLGHMFRLLSVWKSIEWRKTTVFVHVA